MKQFNIPMIVMGGGGYTIRNVARYVFKNSYLFSILLFKIEKRCIIILVVPSAHERSIKSHARALNSN